jgi:multidrug efflux system membrane fusion protein
MRARIAVVSILVAGFTLAGVWYVFGRQKASDAVLPAQRSATPAVPATVGIVALKNIPVHVGGIGTVQAYNTVTVKSRVDGELQQLFFKEGQDVHAGDLLAQIDPRPFEAQLRQAEAARARDVAQLDTAKLDFARSSELVGRGFATRQTYDTQKNQIAQLEAAVQSDDAVIDSARLQLSYARIVSPLDGRTGVRLLDAGNMVRATDAAGIVAITQMRPISALFTLTQELLPDIVAAMRNETLTVEAFTQDGKRLLAVGTLELVDNIIDQATGTARLKAKFPNDNEVLWPGQFVNVRVRLAVRENVAVIDESAVQRNQNGNYVWIVKADDTVEVRPVKIDQINNREAVVSGGIGPGEQVIIDGQSRLRPGAKIVRAKVREPQPRKEASAADGAFR